MNEQEIILYTKSGCPKCKVLEKELKTNGISYNEITDINHMIELGLREVPVLSVNGKLLRYSDAISYIRGE